MTSHTEIVRSEGFTLCRLVWNLLGRQPKGYVEQVLAANQGLADAGTELPVGIEVVFPLDTLVDTESPTQAVRLWD